MLNMPEILTEKQREILIGGLLGDLSIEKSARSKNARFKIERSQKDINYLKWQHYIFKDFCKKIALYERFDKRYNKIYKSCYLRSKAFEGLNDFYKNWYSDKKNIPRDFKLTPQILSVWFADDGCITQYSKNHSSIKFSTECFDKSDVDFLIKELNEITKSKFNSYHKNKNKNENQYIIKGSTQAAHSVMMIIKPYLLEMGMERKVKDIGVFKSKSHYKILEFLNKNNWSLACDITFCKNPNSLLNKAVEKGFVQKRKLETDKRVSEYKITPKGVFALDNNLDLNLFKK